MRLLPKKALVTTAILIVAWGATFCLPRAAFQDLPLDSYQPSLPLVSVPFVHGSDVVSSVPDLFRAIALCIAALALVEVAKVQLAASKRGWIWVYFSLLGYQATLAVDILRQFAPDWYGYSLYFVRLIELSHENPRPDVLPLPTPFLSLVFLILSLSLSWRTQKSEQRASSQEAACEDQR